MPSSGSFDDGARIFEGDDVISPLLPAHSRQKIYPRRPHDAPRPFDYPLWAGHYHGRRRSMKTVGIGHGSDGRARRALVAVACRIFSKKKF